MLAGTVYLMCCLNHSSPLSDLHQSIGHLVRNTGEGGVAPADNKLVKTKSRAQLVLQWYRKCIVFLTHYVRLGNADIRCRKVDGRYHSLVRLRNQSLVEFLGCLRGQVVVQMLFGLLVDRDLMLEPYEIQKYKSR